MGGDNAPQAPVGAGVKAVNELGIEVVFAGKEDVIKSELSKHKYDIEKIRIVNADEIIGNDEEPAKAVRRKKNSSVVTAAYCLKNDEGDAMLSMGSTGALLAAGLLVVGRIKGIQRPCLATLLPTAKGPRMLTDAGANTNCRPINLVQFAVMGSIYMSEVMGMETPKVGLLSNGEERGKGDSLTKETYPYMEKAPINFIGNVEGRDVMYGTADVTVCDGFSGNVVLKTIEGMGKVVSGMIKDMFYKNILSKISALLVSDGLKAFKKKMDYREYGGAPLLGLKKPVIKGHGSSDEKAVYSAIIQAKKCVEENIIEKTSESLKKLGDFCDDIERNE